MKLLVSVVIIAVIACCLTVATVSANDEASWGEPLFLSKYLPNQASTARQLSQVPPSAIGWNAPSYSGYLTVNQTTFSNMFFWFFPALNNDPNAPVLLWLQGGPGGASMFGLFSENGPFSVSTTGALLPREYTWNKRYSMLYIDNPVGAGYSFTSTDAGYVESEDDVAADLYSALSQFFQVFPDYAKNDFYVTGESYAGKYVPAISYHIHNQNQNPKNAKINLKGLAIGDGATDPLIMFTQYSDLLYWLGLADENEVEVIRGYEHRIRDGILKGKFVDAFHAFDEFLNGDFFHSPTYYTNITGTTTYFNYNNPIYPNNPYPQFLQMNATRQAIHVGGYGYWDYNASVEAHLLNDWMVSMAPVMPTLLDNYKVMTYNGNYDVILGAPAAEKFYRTIPWEGQDEYRKTSKKVWYPQGSTKVAGYVRSVRNYRQVVVAGAGHMVPLDQPEAAYDMITRFVDGIPF